MLLSHFVVISFCFDTGSECVAPTSLKLSMKAKWFRTDRKNHGMCNPTFPSNLIWNLLLLWHQILKHYTLQYILQMSKLILARNELDFQDSKHWWLFMYPASWVLQKDWSEISPVWEPMGDTEKILMRTYLLCAISI